jgi:hypothetical protein
VNFINFIALPLWEVWDLLVGGDSLQLKVSHKSPNNGADYS